jgi:hypothetical protein
MDAFINGLTEFAAFVSESITPDMWLREERWSEVWTGETDIEVHREAICPKMRERMKAKAMKHLRQRLQNPENARWRNMCRQPGVQIDKVLSDYSFYLLDIIKARRDAEATRTD